MDQPAASGSAVAVAVRGAGTSRRYRAGQALFHAGDPSDHVVLIVEGRVKIVAVSGDGSEAVLAVRGAGELVGELSAIDGRDRSAAAIALDPLEVVVLAAPVFCGLLATEPGVALALLEVLVARLRDADRHRIEFGSQQTMTRLAARLVQLADDYGHEIADGGIRIDLPITQEELAGWVGASRESVARAFAALRKAGVVATARRTVTILDLERLGQLAG